MGKSPVFSLYNDYPFFKFYLVATKTAVLFTLSNHTNILSRTNIHSRMLQWENLIFTKETSQGAASYHCSGNLGNIQSLKLPQMLQTPIWIYLILHSCRWCCLQSHPCISSPHCEPMDPSALRKQASSSSFIMAFLQFFAVCNLEVQFYYGHVHVHVHVRTQHPCLTSMWTPGTLNI